MTAGNPNRTYYPALDGLRGLAILLVVVYHNFGFINYFFFGWLGVDLFFVLSGFLITGILLETKGQPGYLRNFFARRILRIFPVYYLTLIAFLLIIPAITTLPVNISYYKENQWWLWTYLQNWLYIFKPNSNAQALNHLWSLAVEEQYYLLWPIAIILIKKPIHLLLLMLFILLAVMGIRFWIWNLEIKELAYYNLYTFSRIDGICIGCIIALLYKINLNYLNKYSSLIVLLLAGINFIFYFFNSRYSFSFPYLAIVGYTTFAVIFGLLVHEAVQGKNKIINFIFTIPLLRFFGKISYSFYVFHWPVFLCLSPRLRGEIEKIIPEKPAIIMVSLIATFASLMLSIVSYYTIERYFLRLKKNFIFRHEVKK